jgi:hypothetical protein
VPLESRTHVLLVTEATVAGDAAGMAVMAWVIFYLLPYWSNSSHFANFSKSCIISDIGAECQVYCPTN